MMDRRTFLQSAALAGVGIKSAVAQGAKPVRLAVIGPGSRGQEVLRQFLHVPGVELQAVCDIYEPRFAEVDTLAGRPIPHTMDYRDLLARKDIDAVLIASPLKYHAEHVIAAAKAGIPIYGEKALGFTPDDCQRILAELVSSKVLYQVGHQYRYASWIQESMRRIAKGEIGDVTHVYAYWHRNGDWRRPVPSPDPDKKLEHLINWRLYRETSGGLVTELGSHHIDIANWVFGEQPESVLGTTSIVRYNDGRTVGDNVQATFKYSRGRRLVFSSITDNAKNANELWIYGTLGSVQITIEDATFYYEKKKSNTPALANKTIVERGVETGASYSTAGEMPYRGPGEKIATGAYEDPTLAACRSFIECVRGEHKPFADSHVGYRSAIACSVAHDAVFTEVKTAIPLPRV